MPPRFLPNALRIVLRPDPRDSFSIGLRSGGEDFRLRIVDGWVEARRGRPEAADLTLTGSPWEVLASVVGGLDGELGAEVDGDPGALPRLREMVEVPEGLRDSALAEVAAVAT
jgi:hypothetical protein